MVASAALTLVGAPAPVAAAGPGDVDGARDSARERLSEFGEWFRRGMDLECRGDVPVERLVEVMRPGRAWPRPMNWALALDHDSDGFVRTGEVGLGMWGLVDRQLQRQMLGDVDGDGALDPREHALMVPDPGAERDAAGLSKAQDGYFRESDRDGDGVVSHAEALENQVDGYIGNHWSRMLLFHLYRADADGDGVLERKELTGAIAAAGGPVPTSEALDELFDKVAAGAAEAPVARIVLEDVSGPLYRVGRDVEARAAIDGALASLMAPDCDVTPGGPR